MLDKIHQSSSRFALAGHALDFWLSHLALPLILGILLAFVYPMTLLDMTLIAPYYNADTQSFPLRKHWFLTVFMHSTVKYVVILIALLTLGMLLHSVLKPAFKVYRRRLAWIFTGLVLGPALISIMKGQSNLSCPQDLAIFGGDAPRLELLSAGFFTALPAGVNVGHCFPGGHASGGFALLAFYFGLRDRWPRAANLALAIALLLGLSMGWSQMARGEHFMSHNLWTVLIMWMTLLILYVSWPPEINDQPR